MIPECRCALVIAALLSAQMARADVFVEVTPANQPPDGLHTIITIQPFQVFDVFVWGTGPDSALLSLRLDVGAATPIEFALHAPGIVNPGGQFGLALPGTLNASINRIEQIIVGAIPPAMVPLPAGPGQALRIYAGLVASPAVGGRMNSFNVLAQTNAGVAPTVHTIGVQEVPGPGPAGMGLVVLVSAARRRRRAVRPR